MFLRNLEGGGLRRAQITFSKYLHVNRESAGRVQRVTSVRGENTR